MTLNRQLSQFPSELGFSASFLDTGRPGGLAGGGPASHADGVMKGLLEYVEQFATRIRAANNS